ncbi:intermembrane lipid transfer protein Vps13 isoform X2 [Bacillus rossius redtenbacheri]|uniref:intermembrane lipid transfer protein Vps13 isoform X2 n=1 Tax=Bacillus rossius redtenbacheri TaxID=93214 RepID=UPI002FDF08F9
MVFESIVAELLNKFLGDYVESFDRKKLQIGIFGGDVKLEELFLKETVLDDLDLPIKIAFGQLGKLVLKIPWKNLYGAPVEAAIEDLYLLVVPNRDIKYDAAKEEKALQSAKQAQLRSVEEAKKREKEKDKPKRDDTFVEKLATQIIKNVQVRISKIHIRYEDRDRRVAMGLTLNNLSLQTTDEHGTPRIMTDAESIFHKILSQNHLAVYWNCDTKLYAGSPRSELLSLLKAGVYSDVRRPDDYVYMLGPINLSARLKLNPKPETDGSNFTIPKVHLTVSLENLNVGVSKMQFLSVINLLDSLEQMTLGAPYRKYRPAVKSYRGHYKEWWLFAIRSVLEQEIRRRHQNWDLRRIMEHRRRCKEYAAAYKTKLTARRVPGEVQAQLEDLERQLDIFNIVLARQIVESEVEREGRVTAEKKAAAATTGWFSGWWGTSKKQEDDSALSAAAIAKQFEEAMTPEEKSKLFRAIDYHEGVVPTSYPDTFIAVLVTFDLKALAVTVRDDSYTDPKILLAEVKGMWLEAQQRPSASAVKVGVKVQEFSMLGIKQGPVEPQLVATQTSAGAERGVLLDVMFETNPLDGGCDQRVRVSSQPVRVVYDAQTVNKLVDVFRKPETASLHQLQAAAQSKLADFREMSATGLQHVIAKSPIMDLKIDLQAPYIIVPRNGFYTGVEDIVVVNLGSLRMWSMPRERVEDAVHEQFVRGRTEEQILEQMISRSYDQFQIELCDIQVLLSLSGEDWQAALASKEVTPLHLLQPSLLQLDFRKCLVPDDPRLPRLKLLCRLPSISLSISDERMFRLVVLVTSVPWSEASSEEDLQTVLHPDTISLASSLSMLNRSKERDITSDLLKKDIGTRKETGQELKESVQFTELDIFFEMGDFVMSILKYQPPAAGTSAGVAKKLLELRLSKLELEMKQQTFNMNVYIRLGGIGLEYIGLPDKTLFLDTPMTDGSGGPYLLTIKYVNAHKKGPDFHTVHGSVLQLVDLRFSYLEILLHQQALLSVMEFAGGLRARLAAVLGESPAPPPRPAPSHGQARPPLAPIAEEGPEGALQPRRKPRRKSVVETVDFKLKAQLSDLNIYAANTDGRVADLALSGLVATVVVKKSHTEVDARLTKVLVLDPKSATVHHTIVTVMGSEAMAVQVVMYNLDEEDDNSDKLDMSIRVDMAGIRIIFLNWFVSSLVEFLNTFQTAQDMIAGAAAHAAEAAKHNVRDMYSKAVRMKLDIKVKAPVVIVPANSRSTVGIMLDFGDLRISNKFTTLQVKNEKGHPAVVDEMDLGLTNLKLVTVKGIVDKAEVKAEHESAILQPISSRLLIQRNLSAGWYKGIPDIEISGRLQTVSITLNHDDYKMAMQVLTENLAEGQKQSAEIVPEKSEHRLATETAERPSSLEVASKETAVVEQVQVEPSQAGKESPPVSTFVKFAFTMDNLIVELFRGGSPTSSDADAHAGKGLARITLHVLSLKGSMLSDGALSTSILLVDCLLDDTRFDRDAVIKRLMERKSESPSLRGSPGRADDHPAVRSMVDITFKQKGSDMFVDMRVFGFTLILNLDYMMKIADFFTSGLAKPPQAAPAQLDQRASGSIKARPASSTQSRTSAQSRASHTKQASEVPSMMTVNVRVERPDIILVETMDDLNTNAIILNTEVMFKLRVSGEHQVMSGSIQDLQLYSCCFNPQRRRDTMAQILRPCSISLAGSTPEGEGLHIDIQITSIRLGVSPGTIELLARVQSAMVKSTEEEEEKVVEEVDYQNIWTQKKFEDANFWFLKTEMGVEAVEAAPGALEAAAPPAKQEVCIVSAPSVVVTMEAGVGTKTLPMIMLQLSFEGSINNWSSQMSVDSGMTLQTAYYNSTLAMWEPLVEPVEEMHDGCVVHSPWELRAVVRMNKQEPVLSPMSPVNEEVEEVVHKPPAMSIEISSKENLEVTLSKTCLDVFSNLSNAFKTAMTEGGLATRIELMAPYVVENDTGLTVTLKLKDSPFKLQQRDESGKGQDPEQVILQDRAKVGLRMAVPEQEATDIALGHQAQDKFLSIRVDERNVDVDLPVVRADKRYFDLHHRGEGNDPWGLVSDVKVQDGGTIITLRSIIQVHNHLQEPVNVYFMMKQGNEVKLAGIVEPGKAINLPFRAVYTPTNELFFNVNGYTVSVVPFVWKQLQNSLVLSKLLQCDPQNREDKEPFFMRVVGEMEQVYFENSKRHTMASTCYNIRLRPAVVLKNCLPVELVCCVQGVATERHVGAGGSMQMPTAEPGRTTVVLRIPDYLDKQWACKREIEESPAEFSVWTFDSYDSAQKMSLDLGMNVVCKNGSNVFTLYCPFWMLNKTGLMLSYRQGDESVNVLFHPPEYKGPVLFSFKAKSFFGKKKAAVRVGWEEWSDRFSLDVAGSSGVITCKSPELVYQIGVQIQLTYSTLTKQVIFTPYFVLINNARAPVECQEADLPESPWTHVGPGECSPFWPRSSKGSKEMRVRVCGTQEATPPFSYETVHTTLLRLDNKFGGLNVDVQVTEGAVYVAFTSYEPGLAPALIINHTNCPITFCEKGLDNNITLQPKHMMMFTWAKPTGSRQIIWNDEKKKEFTDELRKDGIGELKVVCDESAFWVSFLDGLQRVLLFTPEIAIAHNAQLAGEFEATAQELTVCVHGMGLSVVNNLVRTELLYIGIASSGIIWETRKLNGRRFRPMVSKDVDVIEEAYQRYLSEKQVAGGASVSNVTLENNMEVNFDTNEMLRPHKRVLRRSFQAGVWFQMKTSPHTLQLHAKLNRLQIDNQMYDCVFPVILAPVPPPKSVAADSVLKPFAEMSVVQRVQPYSTITQFKYFKVLIQEFHIKVDMGFINAVLEMFAADEVSEEEEVKNFHTDKELADKPLLAHVTVHSSQEQKNFYDLLHFSPLKIHLSFSLSGGSTSGQKSQEAPRFLSVLTQSLGVTLTDIHDVVFKLAFFERQYTFLTQRQLVSEATMHYVGQGVKQLYVLVLGLDVIGNPYGLVLGLTQGVEDLFYEPFQGAIEGPEEFAEGLLIGVRSLFGHTLGGAAGAVSRITGAMGKGVAALTFDKDYQRKRREAMLQRPANVQMGLARSGRGLVMGVVDGVSGVFTKPIAGAKEEGVEGFFKGVGKGVVGLVTRPTAGVIDFASGSLEAVKRVAEVSEEVSRLRPPRFLQLDGLVRPYFRREAEGNKLLQELNKGRYASTDVYVYHVKVMDGGKEMLMLTNKRVMYIIHNDIFGNWQVEWGVTWDSMETPPRIVDRGVFIPTGEPKKKVLGLFGSSDTGKVVLIKDPEVRVDLVEKMEQLIGK